MIVTLPEFLKIPCIIHGFTLRKLDNGQDFDLNLYNNIRPNRIAKNLKALKKQIGLPTPPLVTCNQIHSNKIIKVTLQNKDPQEIQKIQGDALITNQPNIIIGILTADCLPILLVDKKNKAISAIHAGRKGTQLSIVQQAIEKMKFCFGSKPQNLMAGIGPGIKKCCYEVDILKDNVLQLMETGVLKKNIFIIDQCTSCRNDLYFSYRAGNGETGRMIGFIMLKNL